MHAAAIRDAVGIAYINRGDWVDSCPAIVERNDGRRELVQWGVPPMAAAYRPEQPELPLGLPGLEPDREPSPALAGAIAGETVRKAS